MKKALSAALALLLALSLHGAHALETPDIQKITNEISFEAQEVRIGDTGLALSLPEDWSKGEANEASLAEYYAEDGSAALSLSLLDASMDDIWKLCFVEAGSCIGAHLTEAYVNDTYYLFYTAPLQDRAYLALNDLTALAFTFDYANEEASRNAPALEILGSVNAAE